MFKTHGTHNKSGAPKKHQIFTIDRLFTGFQRRANQNFLLGMYGLGEFKSRCFSFCNSIFFYFLFFDTPQACQLQRPVVQSPIIKLILDQWNFYFYLFTIKGGFFTRLRKINLLLYNLIGSKCYGKITIGLLGLGWCYVSCPLFHILLKFTAVFEIKKKL